MKVLVDARWTGSYGIARVSAEVLRRLPFECKKVTRGSPVSPLAPAVSAAAMVALRPDVYYTPGFVPPLPGTGVPVVLTIHDLIHLDEPEERSASKVAYYQAVVKPGVLRAARIVTVSAYSRSRIVEWSGVDPARVVVAPNGVSPVFTPTGPRHPGVGDYLLYVGNDKPHKDLPTLLAALRILRCRGVPLVFAGSCGPYLQQLVGELGLLGVVRILGPVPDQALARLYRGARALIFPSRHEGFGLPVLEAMASGTPVVAADIPPVREVAGDAAMYAPPSSPESLAEAIDCVLFDEDLRRSMAEAGLRRAESFAWSNTSDVVAAAIRAAAEARGAA